MKHYHTFASTVLAAYGEDRAFSWKEVSEEEQSKAIGIGVEDYQTSVRGPALTAGQCISKFGRGCVLLRGHWVRNTKYISG